ncbi:response regulator [candidate division KSB1 bacterium]
MKQRILAVDDEPHILVLLERIIGEKTPYYLKTTNNPLEVFDILENEQFDLIITDLKMPGMDGMDLLHKIKEQGRKEEVIIMTAYGSLESATEALSQGVFDYITKPFKKDQFLITIDRAMRLQRIKNDAEKLSGIYTTEPYEEARRLFDREYIGRLSRRTGNDETVMSERSGLSIDYIRSVMDTENNDSS